MAVNDIYEVVDVQTLQEQQVLNVYFYEQRGAFTPLAGTTAQALADEWAETILPSICAPQSGDILHTEVRVRNLFNTADTGLTVTGVAGSQVSDNDITGTFTAYALKLNTDNSAVRPGAKRLAGVGEAGQNDGVPSSTSITNLNLAADAIAAPITGGLIITDDIMFPVVVKRIRTGTPGNYEYRLPESSGEATVGTIIEALVKLLITSQISRKIGIGV